MRPIGHTTWALAGGRMPLTSSGLEPEFTSFDLLAVLNAGDAEARVELTIFYADREPGGPYRLVVGARRVRQVRFNDLIDPEALPLDTPYGCVVRANVPIVVQFARQDTRQAANAIFSVMALPIDA
jgi:hypothetical protein